MLYIQLLFCLFFPTLMSSCSNDETEATDLTIVAKTLEFAPEAGTKAFLIRANSGWNVTAAPWVKVSPGKGGAGTLKVEVSVTENTANERREGIAVFSSGNLTDTITIIQEGKNYVPSDNQGMVSDAAVLVSKMNIGWNLGNSLEACSATSASETMWGNPKTDKKLIDAIKAAGFNAIRIPCAWNGYIEDQETYKIKDSWLARVKEVVDYCIDNEMYVVLNIHWDGGWLEENPTYAKQESVNKKQKALWKQIATHFIEYNEHLLFAGTNEVHAGYSDPTNENIEVQLSYNQTFVDAVRSTGGKNAFRNLVVQSYNTNIDQAVQYFKLPKDNVVNRLILEVHYYDPYDFTLQTTAEFKTQWGRKFSGGDVSSFGQENWADEKFGKMKTNFVDKGIPVILGEYGPTFRAALTEGKTEHIESRNNYLSYITKTAKANGIVPFYWDNGATGNNGSGIFNRSTGAQAYPDAVQALIEATQP